jgi:hypothetical protein
MMGSTFPKEIAPILTESDMRGRNHSARQHSGSRRYLTSLSPGDQYGEFFSILVITIVSHFTSQGLYILLMHPFVSALSVWLIVSREHTSIPWRHTPR